MLFQTRKTSSEHKFRYVWNLRALRPSIDSNVINTIKVQKRSKDIGKIIHVTSGVQPLFYEAKAIRFVRKRMTLFKFLSAILKNIRWI